MNLNLNEFEPQYHINCYPHPPPPTPTHTHTRTHTHETTQPSPPRSDASMTCHHCFSYSFRIIPSDRYQRWKRWVISTSPNGNGFRATGPLWSTGDWWFPLTKRPRTAFMLNIRLNKKLSRRWFEMLACSLWHHCNDLRTQYVPKYVRTVCRAFFTLVLIYIFLLVEWYSSFTHTIQGCFTGAVVWFSPVSDIWSWRICVKLVATYCMYEIKYGRGPLSTWLLLQSFISLKPNDA